jgi:hypothetical protein
LSFIAAREFGAASFCTDPALFPLEGPGGRRSTVFGDLPQIQIATLCGMLIDAPL